MKNKRERLKCIEDTIKEELIVSQEELSLALKKRGFTLTQATLSRDLKELKIIKAPTSSGKYAYIKGAETGHLDHPDHSVHRYASSSSIAFSGNLAVIKTKPGYASGIASDIDQIFGNDILGTIAGDDTIFVVIKENISKDLFVTSLIKILPHIVVLS